MGTAGEKRTPMAWQHRDLNYHNSYQDRYNTGVEMNSMRHPGPPSTSDRLSHRTDKSWRTQRDSNLGYNVGNATPVYQGQGGSVYPPSRPSYSTGRPTSRPQSPDSSSTSSSSTSSHDTERGGAMMGPPQGEMGGIYGYEGYYPGYVQGMPMSPGVGYPPSMNQGMYPACTMKSAKSVPSLAQGTWDGEPCPVHGIDPMSLQGMPPGPPMMMPMPIRPPRRSASIYDMRMLPPPPPIYGTIPHRPPPPPTIAGDRRSLVGVPAIGAPHHPHPMGIPPQLLPPMVRPRPLVVSEEGATEPLPVRAPRDKGGLAIPMKAAGKDGVDGKGDRVCSKEGICVLWIVLSVVATGLVLGLLLVFIL